MFKERITLLSSKATDTYLNFVPDTGINWMIRNLDTTGQASLEFYNSDSSLAIEIDNQLNGIHSMNNIFHCSDTIYYRLKNLSSASEFLSGEGYVSREDDEGDTLVQNIEAKANLEYLDVRPGAGEEWSVHNVMSEGAFELYKTDGTNSILSKKVISPHSALTGLHLYCTNSLWWRIVQIDSGSKNMGFDGIRVV